MQARGGAVMVVFGGAEEIHQGFVILAVAEEAHAFVELGGGLIDQPAGPLRGDVPEVFMVGVVAALVVGGLHIAAEAIRATAETAAITEDRSGWAVALRVCAVGAE